MNIILLTNNEEFIRFLDPESLTITETEEQGNISSLKIIAPINDFKNDVDDFRPGHKLFITGADGLRDCLYVINEQVDTDLWSSNSITVTAEDVITELNYASLVSMSDISTKTVSVSSSLLNQFFGEWYHIGTVDTGLLRNVIQIDGTLSRMSLLRYIEETTGNIFVTEYEKDEDTNVIIRTLSFRRPNNVSRERNNVIDLGHNTEDVQYNVDESDSYRAIAPLMDWSEDSEISRSNMINVIENFRELEISKSTDENVVQVPFLFTEAVTTGVYPYSNEGVLGSNYWRRTPSDSLYKFYPGLLTYTNTVSVSRSSNIMGSASATLARKGYMKKCSDAGTYTYWNGTGTAQSTCAIGDVWVSNGTSWQCVKVENEGNKPNYIQVDTGLYNAPFTKRKGELHITDDSDTKIQYHNIYTRQDYTEQIGGADTEPTTTETAEEGDTPTVEESTNTQNSKPKIGTITTTETNEIKIYNACCTALKEKRYPTIDLEVKIKDDLDDHYKIYDTVPVKIPLFDSLIKCTVTKTEKNPHTPGENTITLESQEMNGAYDLKDPYFVLEDSIHKHNTSFNFSGKLVELIPGTTTESGETIETLTETGLASKWVSVAVIRPSSTRTIIEQHKTQTTTTTTGTSYWTKYGVSPDKSQVCGIGYTSTGADTHAWGTNYKGIFKNYCPNCKRTGTLRWNRGKRAKSAARQDGEFTCSKCDSDYSVEGNEKGDTHRKMTKISFSKSNSTDSSKLLNGKLVYSTSTTKTTTTPGKTTTTTETLAAETKLYSAKTDSNGEFTIPLKLIGLEDKNYTIKCTFSGDDTYSTCSDDCSVTIPPVKNYKTVYSKSTVGGSKSTSTTHTAIKRGSSNSNCTNLKRQSGVVSTAVINKAKSIVGNKTGIAAAKALAKWNYENITYTYKEGFYQSPAKTLSSKKGNCCCKTDLFLQMCEAVDLTTAQGGDLIIKYVHYHTSSKGHIYALIRHKDNAKGTYVDVCHSDYWGSVCSGYYNLNYMRTSSYPCLTIERSY